MDHLAHVEIRLGPHYGTDRAVPVPGGLRVADADLCDGDEPRRQIIITLSPLSVPLNEVGSGNAKVLISHTLVAKFASSRPGVRDLDTVILLDTIDREREDHW